MHCTENLCLALAMNDRNGIRVLGNLSVALFTLGLHCKIRYDTSFCNRCSTDAVSFSKFFHGERIFCSGNLQENRRGSRCLSYTGMYDIIFKSLYFLKL